MQKITQAQIQNIPDQELVKKINDRLEAYNRTYVIQHKNGELDIINGILLNGETYPKYLFEVTKNK
ncbi:MAG: hypothetical protein ACOC22_03515 [bacterium]